MANARVIRRNFFNDPLIAGKYNIGQRYLLIGLACASDDYGRFWWNVNNLKSIIYPTDNKQGKWIEKNLELFFNDELLCKYEVNNTIYGHFPYWFDKSFCLKQRLDHPKPDELPDCKTHVMNNKNTRKKRESSLTNKDNINKNNSNKINNGSNGFVKKKYLTTDFKLDSTGKSIGYCSKCNVSDFYEPFAVWGDSRCCNAEIRPKKEDKRFEELKKEYGIKK